MKRSTRLKFLIKKILLLVLNPRFLLCFGLAWIITNGWSYILFAIGTLADIRWMIAVSGAYMTFLWFPFTPEKIITLTLSIALLRWLFPHDEHTLGQLRRMYRNAKKKHKARKQKNKATDEVAANE